VSFKVINKRNAAPPRVRAGGFEEAMEVALLRKFLI
jgi:hypothetical protein